MVVLSETVKFPLKDEQEEYRYRKHVDEYEREVLGAVEAKSACYQYQIVDGNGKRPGLHAQVGDALVFVFFAREDR